MGQEVAGISEAVAVGPGAEHAPEPIGAYLSRQRRLRGISLDELAGITCIPLRSLERLESGAFDETPDGFARGFVRTVARALGLDPDETVSRMLPEATTRSRRRPIPLPDPMHPLVWLVAGGLALALLIVTIVELRSGPAVVEDPSASYVYRHDAVRELAREQSPTP